MNRNDRSVVGLAMLAHGLVHTYELSVPILVSIWLVEFATTPAELGLVVTVGMGLFGAGALPGGVLADRLGSQRLIVGCLAGMGGAFLLLGFAPSIPAIALALVAWGAAASVYHPAGLSLLSTGVTERGKGFAYHGIAGNVGIAVGPLLTTLLLVVVDWQTAVRLLAVPAFLAAAVAAVVDIDERPDATPTEDGGDRTGSVDSLAAFVSTSRTLLSSPFALVFLITFCSGVFYRGVLTFLPDLIAGLEVFQPVTVLGEPQAPSRYIYSGLLMVGVAGQYLGGRLTDRVAPERGITWAFGLLAVVTALYLPLASTGPGALLLASAFLGFLLFVVQPLYQATVAEYSPEDARGLSYGYTYLGVFGFGALGAVIAGWVLSAFSPAVLFGVLAVFAALAALIGVVLTRSGNRP